MGRRAGAFISWLNAGGEALLYDHHRYTITHTLNDDKLIMTMGHSGEQQVHYTARLQNHKIIVILFLATLVVVR